jgi:hypothetical protein
VHGDQAHECSSPKRARDDQTLDAIDSASLGQPGLRIAVHARSPISDDQHAWSEISIELAYDELHGAACCGELRGGGPVDPPHVVPRLVGTDAGHLGPEPTLCSTDCAQLVASRPVSRDERERVLQVAREDGGAQRL